VGQAQWVLAAAQKQKCKLIIAMKIFVTKKIFFCLVSTVNIQIFVDLT
jgi:hypothetical protein